MPLDIFYKSILEFDGAPQFDWYGQYDLPTVPVDYPVGFNANDGYCHPQKAETAYAQNEYPIVDGRSCPKV